MVNVLDNTYILRTLPDPTHFVHSLALQDLHFDFRLQACENQSLEFLAVPGKQAHISFMPMILCSSKCAGLTSVLQILW